MDGQKILEKITCFKSLKFKEIKDSYDEGSLKFKEIKDSYDEGMTELDDRFFCYEDVIYFLEELMKQIENRINELSCVDDVNYLKALKDLKDFFKENYS